LFWKQNTKQQLAFHNLAKATI